MSLSNASIVRLAHSDSFQKIQRAIQQQKIIDWAIAVQQIPAPTFDEKRRAEYVAGEFRRIGLQNVEMDDLFNVYGWLLQPNDAPVLMISAHTDTVFSLETDLSVRREDDKIYGVGLGDNSLGVAGVLTLAELFIQHEIPHTASICFVANTREEGLGDLEGMRAAVQRLGEVKAAIVIEGMALGRIYHSGIAVRRLKLTVTTPGGHSWLHFGQPSAIHALMRFGSEMIALEVPEDPRTTYNIGVIEGGSSVNTIAAEAHCLIDLRSAAMESLADLEKKVRAIGERLTTPEIKFNFEVVGDRPAGSIPGNHPLVKLAKDAHQAIRMRGEVDSGSTDANIPLSLGIPAVCVGITYGGNAHRLDEYIEIEPIENGMWQLVLLTTAASNGIARW